MHSNKVSHYTTHLSENKEMTALLLSDGDQGLQLPQSSKSLQQLIHEPMTALSQWYTNISSTSRREEDEENDIQLVQYSTSQPGSPHHPRLHVTAEASLSSLRAGTASKMITDNYPNGVDFLNLPVGVHLHIFSFLDSTSLCRLAQSCKYMDHMTSDPLLWTRLLKRDVHSWRVIGHLSHPQVYQDASSDLTPKQIYCQCSYHRDKVPRQSFAHPITGRLRSLVRKIQGHIPRLLMFGSGLESVPLVRSMLWEKDSPYHPIGLYPGKDGVGSGVCIQHRDIPLNLITLYTATRAEREAAQAGQQARVNRLVSAYHIQGESGDHDTELTPAVQQLCRHTDAAVLVVNACQMTEDAVRLDQLMLQAMLHSNVLQTTPLLVLSCQPKANNENDASLTWCPPVEVANRLRLQELQQPWQVRSLVLEQYQSLQDGMDWLLGAANY